MFAKEHGKSHTEVVNEKPAPVCKGNLNMTDRLKVTSVTLFLASEDLLVGPLQIVGPPHIQEGSAGPALPRGLERVDRGLGW